MLTKNNKNTSNLLSISILALAASLTYFTFELSQFIGQIPDILENVRNTSDKIEPTLDEISQIRDLIEPVLLEVSETRKQIPPILKEVENIRKIIPPVLDEIAEIRAAIPPIIVETTAIRKQLPAVLNSADKASESVTQISIEMKAYQPVAKQALLQVDGVRKEIPGILSQTNELIDRARVAARDASSGAMTGALGGLITAPFRLVGGFGSSVLGLSKSEADDYSKNDLKNVQKHTMDLLQSGALDDTLNWTNPDTHRRTELTLQKIYQQDSHECRQVLIKSWLKSQLTLEKEVTACLNNEGEWEHQDDKDEW
ncbi:hypothetical protein MNBD_GAMMA09-1338 [hydrothermal vent metagenome]|uniref:Uncharacterized protein n=1 Tax=hydrothermal vent metagenome TaxID=652676 RepID=A0A3B0XHU0_9ZZZZ